MKSLALRRSIRPAITLLELLVVLGILAVLFALTLSAIVHIREVANRLSCANHLKHIGLAMHQHRDTYGVFPSNGGWDGKQGIQATDGSRIRVTVFEYQLSLTFTWGVGELGRVPRDQTGS